jgi:hypothetical protein
VVKRKPCRLRCGRSVDVFTEQGHLVQLDIEPPLITVDLSQAQYRNRIYEYHGPRVGWAIKFLPQRGWRELRLLHDCAETQPQQQHQHKRQRQKERKR